MHTKWKSIKSVAKDMGISPASLTRKAEKIGAKKNWRGTAVVDLDLLNSDIESSPITNHDKGEVKNDESN